MIAHCLFEQSGTFKNEFKKLGIAAYDYDILNDFGETDFIIDLFNEIENSYNGEFSIFDNFNSDDIILSFFPCVRFESQIMLGFRDKMYQQKNWSYKKKMQYDMKLLSELKRYYDLVNKMFIICIDKNLKLVMENLFSEEHFLRRYWCYPPAIIDRDRRLNGDFFKKPTQFWFLNFKPKDNLIFESVSYNDFGCSISKVSKKFYNDTGAINRKVARSMISPEYANRFIRRYLLNVNDL